MGNSFEVSGWTFEDRFGNNRPEWYYKELYRGESLMKALWCALRSRGKYGCVKLEMR